MSRAMNRGKNMKQRQAKLERKSKETQKIEGHNTNLWK